MDGGRKSTQRGRYKKLRDLLVSARLDAGLTQAQVASVLRKPQSFVSKIESGERRIDLIELLDILKVLGTDEIQFVRALNRKGES